MSTAIRGRHAKRFGPVTRWRDSRDRDVLPDGRHRYVKPKPIVDVIRDAFAPIRAALVGGTDTP